MMLARWLLLWLLLALASLGPLAEAAEEKAPPPAKNGSDSYLVQVGDEVRVILPGEETLDKGFDVDRLGRLVLPEVGSIMVAGMTERAMEEEVRKRLEKVYRDLGALRVYVKERRLLIKVLGYVNQPGEIVLPADAGLQTALRTAGGLRPGAQLDRIQIRQGDKTSTFDYKKYLDSGDASGLPKLQSLDTIFVPASPMIGNVEVAFDPAKMTQGGDAAEDRDAIKVFGEVNHPGSFSYKDSLSLVDVLMRSGGVTRYASVEQIRIISKNEPVVFDLKHYLDSGDEKLLPKLIPGATIFVPRQEEEIKAGANTVYVMGEVQKPGAYEGKKGASFMDILANAGGPSRFADSRNIRILRADGKVQPFDLSAFAEGGTGKPPEVKPGDAIFVSEKTDMNEKSWLQTAPSRAVRVMGEVVRPDRYEWSNEMSLLDLLSHAGGPTARADTAHIEIVTPGAKGKSKVIEFDLDAFLKRGGSEKELPRIVAGSTIRVHDLPQDPSDNKSQWVRQAADKSIYVFGQVGAPGRYRFTDEMNFLDLLSAADGPTAAADIHNIRINHRSGAHPTVSKLDLGLFFETGDENLLPRLATGDSVYVPQKDVPWTDQPKEDTVRVLGSVNKPGRYKFTDKMTLLDLLAEAGGTSATAYVRKIAVVNLSCCKNQARVFDLIKFSKTGNYDLLPVLRAGDTVYVPDQSQSMVFQARETLKDIFQLVSLGTLMTSFGGTAGAAK